MKVLGKPRQNIGVRAPEAVRRRLDALVTAGRFTNRSEAALGLVERGLAQLEPAAPATPDAPKRASKPKRERLERLWFRTNGETANRFRAYAARQGFTNSSEALASLLVQALEDEEGRRAVPAQKADEVTEALCALGSFVDRMGPGVLGMLHLLAHWAVKSGGVKVTEDELLAEVFAVGGTQWQQLVEESAVDVPVAVETR